MMLNPFVFLGFALDLHSSEGIVGERRSQTGFENTFILSLDIERSSILLFSDVHTPISRVGEAHRLGTRCVRDSDIQRRR